MISTYFEQIFSATAEEKQLLDRYKFQTITVEQGQGLLAPIIEKEVRDAVFAMHPEKSSGIDGLNPAFFQTYWDIVGSDVVKFCKRNFETGELTGDINSTLVCLIPKVKQPKQVSDLRPISLCNVLMRILSKIMANILKPCLQTLISDNQSAFIEGRLLTDNALIAFEINHYIKRKTQGSTGIAGFKIDVSKAYDRLEWCYIEKMLNRFGFPSVWVDRVMTCVKTISYSFVHEGKIVGKVHPQRGVRQGDPISPYLYILCAEGLSSSIRCYEEAGLIHGCRIARGAPSISHLLFADDCYFFFRANQAEAAVMKSILSKYEGLSGQVVNYNKSGVMFSPNTKTADRSLVCELLGVQEIMKPEKYLGMPMWVGKDKTEVFGFISDRIGNKLQGWNTKALSRQGKLTLIKTAAQAIPNFWMSLFLIPANLCESIERKLNAFWWGSGTNGRGVKWLAWDKLCGPKSSGGLGVRGLRNFNIALLAKQGWRILNSSNSLVTMMLKAKYFPNTGFLEAEIGKNHNFVWRSILAGKDVIRSGARRKIGDGADTNVWTMPWLPDLHNGCITTDMPNQLSNIVVRSLMDNEYKKWDEDIVCNIFDE